VRVAFHVDQLWFAAPGGIGTYVRELLVRLDGDSVELVPFSSRWPQPPPTMILGSSPLQQLRAPMRVVYPSWAAMRRPRLPSRFGHLDVIHATNHAAIPPARAGQALVATVHDLAFATFPDLFPDRWRKLYERGVRIAERDAALILTPSQHVADELAARGVAHERLRVTPLAPSAIQPVEHDDPLGRATRAQLEPNAPFLLVVGTIEPRKNLPRLVRAFRRAVATGSLPHHLVLAGPAGWHQEALASEIAADDDDRVHIIGRVDARALDVLYRDAAAVAYLSLYEGFGLPVIDSLARAKPTLASDIGAIRELAEDAALLVDPLDEEPIAEGIVRILTDDALRDDLSVKGPARAAEFSWENTARATLDAYRDAVERTHP
jgi:glycosyltransferase involved in cell wall biosynthesis